LFALKTSYSDFVYLSMLFASISKCLINSINERTKRSRFNDVIDCTYIWVISLKYKFIFEKTTMRHTIRRWLTRWKISDWVNIKFLFWSLNVCITSRDFLNVLSISKCLICLRIESWICKHLLIRRFYWLIEKHLFQWVRWFLSVWMRRIEKVRCVRLNRI
jgi:hypothetical protein